MYERDGVVMPDPLAYFLTWPTYGTWLPGDRRGWVKLHQGHQLPDRPRELEALARMKEGACRLTLQQRQLVERTIDEHCRLRGWEMYVANCRTNHLHVVIAANRHPDEVRDQLKAWTPRRLKEQQADIVNNSTRVRLKWWAERGSKRIIYDEHSLEQVILYVRESQDS